MRQLKLRSAVNANLQNTINTSLILNHVRKFGLTYRSEISKSLNLSLPAVSRAVDFLISQGYLNEHKIISKHGRQAFEVEINARLGISVGISIELPLMKMAKMDMAGNIITVEEVELDTSDKNIEVLIREHVESFVAKRQTIDDHEIPIVALTMGVPASIDVSSGEVHAVLYQNMKGLDLVDSFQKIFSTPVFIENNENLAVIAEKHFEDGIEEENFIYMTVHHGIGAGFYLNGELFRGFNGAAGEIGYQTLGLRGCPLHTEGETFESIAAICEIPNIALRLIHKGKGEDIFQAASYSYEHITHKLIGSMAEKGSLAAQEVLLEYAQLLAMGVANVIVTLNPELVIFGGQLLEIPGCEQFVIEKMQKHLKTLVPFPLPVFRLTRLGREPGVIGACQLGLERTILRNFPYSI